MLWRRLLDLLAAGGIAWALLASPSAHAQTPALIYQQPVGGTPTVVNANNPLAVTGTADAPYAYTPLTPMQSALGITSATALTPPSGSTYAVICASGANANYSTDGTTTPTASVGMPLLQSQCLALSGPTVLANFKAIQQSATATLNVSYYK